MARAAFDGAGPRSKATWLAFGRRDGGDVVEAHAVLAHFGGEGKLELLFHEAAEEAAHRVRLPPGLGDNLLDRHAGSPPQHLDYLLLLALRRRFAEFRARR